PVACPGAACASHRKISFHLFLSGHAADWRGRGSVFCGDIKLGASVSRALERVRLEDPLARSATTSAARWNAFRAVHVLSHVCLGFFPAFPNPCNAKWHNGP